MADVSDGDSSNGDDDDDGGGVGVGTKAAASDDGGTDPMDSWLAGCLTR